nr:MAG TPA: hypothetical protein [Caudoviricetes sp.]
MKIFNFKCRMNFKNLKYLRFLRIGGITPDPRKPCGSSRHCAYFFVQL